MQGKLFLTSKTACFYTNVFNRAYHLAIPFKTVTLIEKRNTIGFVPNAIRIHVESQSHSFISFTKRDLAFDLMMEFWTHCQKTVCCFTDTNFQRKQRLKRQIH